MRLLVINPNTSQSITDTVSRAVGEMVPAGVEVKAVTASFGPRYIASRSAFAVASHGALDAYATHGAGADAVLLACFGDPGLDALREISPVPVIGLVEAAAAEAAAHGGAFAIVTGGALWGPMLEETLRARGLADRCAAIRTVAPNGAAIAADPDGAADMLATACRNVVRETGARCVILGGAGLVGLAARIGKMSPVPVICSVEAGARAAIGKLGCAETPEARREPVDCVGVSAALARALGARP